MSKTRNKGIFKSIRYKDIAYYFNNGGTIEGFYKENRSVTDGIPNVSNYVDLPLASLYKNKVFRVLNIGVRGSLWFSNGVRWVLASKSTILSLIRTPITLAANASNYQTMFSYLFPTNGVDSILRINDRFRLTVHFVKNGIVDTSGRGYSFGGSTNSGLHPGYSSPVNGTPDASVVVMDNTGPSGAANTSWDERHEFARLDKSTIKKLGAPFTQSINGQSTSNLDVSLVDLSTTTPSITNIDLFNFYFNVCYATNATDSGTLKFLMLELLSYSGN